MKAIHNKTDKVELSLREWLAEAGKLESEDKDGAVKEYKRIALVYPSEEQAFNRLMVLFRKMRQPKDELYWIDKAIKNFQVKLSKSKRRPVAAVSRLSKMIAQSTGLSDKKGNSVFQTPPLDRWLKRKQLVQKKISKG